MSNSMHVPMPFQQLCTASQQICPVCQCVVHTPLHLSAQGHLTHQAEPAFCAWSNNLHVVEHGASQMARHNLKPDTKAPLKKAPMGKLCLPRVVLLHAESVHTINQLLTEMDGFEDNTGVVVMAATNRPAALDTALTRPGRFDRIVHLPLPNVDVRATALQPLSCDHSCSCCCSYVHLLLLACVPPLSFSQAWRDRTQKGQSRASDAVAAAMHDHSSIGSTLT